MHLRYDMMGAYFAGQRQHAKTVIKDFIIDLV